MNDDRRNLGEIELNEIPCRKQITFDLNENKLKEHYPHPVFTTDIRYHRKAWGDIARFMKEKNFEHRQYSVYVSKNELSTTQITALIISMLKHMPWLCKCLDAIDVTNVGEQHSLMHIVEETRIMLEKQGDGGEDVLSAD